MASATRASVKLTCEDITRIVRGVLVDALGVDEEEVVAGASICGDLGAESIDHLDIVFRLEHALTTDPENRFKIPRGGLFPAIWSDFEREPWVRDGRLTNEGEAEIRASYPYVDQSIIDKGRVPLHGLQDRIETVEYVEGYMAVLLRARSQLRE